MTRRAKAGTVLPLVALCLTALMGFAGLGVDVGYWEYQQREQQSATDAAALGGAQQLIYSGCPSTANAISAAQKDASDAGYANGGNVTVTPVNPPATGPFATDNCAVTVQITKTGIPSFFAKFFGKSSVSETTSATATLSQNGGACIYLLSTSTWTSFNGATVNAPNCAIAINYSADFDGGTINSPYIGYAGGSPNMGGTTFTQASPAPMLPIANPCPEIAACAYIAANPPPATGCQTLNTNGVSQTIQPGCYQNLNLDGGTITMAPGLYVINGNFNDNNTAVNGTGVTIYTTASGTGPNFDNQTVNLTPPTTGNYAGVLYYQVPSNTTSINFNGPCVNMSGLIYAPGTTSANFNSSSGQYAVLVFGSMNFNNNTAYDFASPAPGQGLVKHAVLAQ